MSPADPPPSPMTLWAVLLAQGEAAHPWASAWRDSCDGVVTVSPEQAPTRLAGLLAGLAEVPADVGVVALVDAADAGADVPDDLRRLAATLDRTQAGAVVRVHPVVDALKRVAGDRVVGGVDRSGLRAPATPQLLRRAALEGALAAAGLDADALGEAADEDPAVLLARCGVPVELAPA